MLQALKPLIDGQKVQIKPPMVLIPSFKVLSQPGIGSVPATPYAHTPNAVELVHTLGTHFPRGGPVQDPVLTSPVGHRKGVPARADSDFISHNVLIT